MLRTAFYIIERPTGGQETKEADEPGDVSEGLAPIEQWTYAEEVSIDFVVAQSRLHRAFGSKIQETGHKTSGHLCVTEEDRNLARDSKGSLLYGELLPRGVNKALSPKHLRAASAHAVFDLGMGTGKVAMQAFLQFPTLCRAVGVELSLARYKIAEKACFNLMHQHPNLFTLVSHTEGKSLEMRSAQGSGTLQLQWGNMLHITDLHEADIVFLETDVSQDVYHDLCLMLMQMKDGGRILSYLDIRKIWDVGPFPFHQLEVNRSLADRFPTSWSVHRGHHFYIWVKVYNKGETRLNGNGLAENPPPTLAVSRRGPDEGAGLSAMSSAASHESATQSWFGRLHYFKPARWSSAQSGEVESAANLTSKNTGSSPKRTAKCSTIGVEPAGSALSSPRQQQQGQLGGRPRQRPHRQLHPATGAASPTSGDQSRQTCGIM